MNTRYKPHGTWRTAAEDSQPFAYGGDHRYLKHVTVEVCDCLEVRSGHVWTNGTFRVTVTGPPGRPRSRTFYGEMAWCTARRYAEDAIVWFRKRDDARRHAR